MLLKYLPGNDALPGILNLGLTASRIKEFEDIKISELNDHFDKIVTTAIALTNEAWFLNTVTVNGDRDLILGAHDHLLVAHMVAYQNVSADKFATPASRLLRCQCCAKTDAPGARRHSSSEVSDTSL